MHINKEYTSPSFKDRQHTIDMVVIHSTHMSAKDSLERLCSKESEVSCHYLIDLEGKVFQLVPEDKVAYHAGVSCWDGREKLNLYSIGIELVDTEEGGARIDNFPKIQMDSLMEILGGITQRYPIPSFYMVAHSDIAPNRKDDPGENFPWGLLQNHGFGLFPRNKYEQENLGVFLAQIGDEGEGVIKMQTLLKEYGYKLLVDGVFGKNTHDVVVAFKRHFDTRAINDVFDEVSLTILQEICVEKSSIPS
jgi:N-acetylmuramoyl-L-alanine amidase